jgi:hypothetical protein
MITTFVACDVRFFGWLDSVAACVNTQPVRPLIACGMALFVLVAGMAPHVHEGQLGQHACIACVASSGQQVSCETPDVAPVALLAETLQELVPASPAAGFPVGAVPGQSPPPRA